MNKGTYTILDNERISLKEGQGSVWKMTLGGDTSGIKVPGQFVNIAVPGRYLRRPISIFDWNSGSVTVVYRVVGGGTMDMSVLRAGDSVDMICGLGNGFSLDGCKNPLLVGGGVGLPPMFALAKDFLKNGISPLVVSGFSSSNDVVLLDEFRAIGIEPMVSTMDGSLGVKGTVMDLLDGLSFDKFYACGPKPMLKALSGLPVEGELSVEERMGCGFGVCMGCSCKTRQGMKRVCKEGPVFKKEDLIW